MHSPAHPFFCTWQLTLPQWLSSDKYKSCSLQLRFWWGPAGHILLQDCSYSLSLFIFSSMVVRINTAEYLSQAKTLKKYVLVHSILCSDILGCHFFCLKGSQFAIQAKRTRQFCFLSGFQSTLPQLTYRSKLKGLSVLPCLQLRHFNIIGYRKNNRFCNCQLGFCCQYASTH